jgi:hypothetical protein
MPRTAGLNLAALLLVLGTASPGLAQGLDPRVLVPLQMLFQAASGQCQAGNPMGCQQAQQLDQAAAQLTQAQGACQMGNQQACMFFQNGAQQVMAAHQQLLMQQQGAQGGMSAPGAAQGYSTQQMQFDHQQRMQQQQQQFQQHQMQMQQQQRQLDQQNQRFLEQLRR